MTATFDLLRSPLRAARAQGGARANGTMLLEASAGTGKTYTITGIVLRLLLEDEPLELPQVLVVTFTIAAAEELKTRLRRALQQALAACEGRSVGDAFLAGLGGRHGEDGAARLRRALQQADQLSVSTIHGFCKRVLDECAFETGAPYDTDFVENELPLLAEAVRDAVRQCVPPDDPLLAALLQQAKLLPEELLKEYAKYRRGGRRVELRPEPPPLPTALARLRKEFAAARAAFDPAALRGLLARCKWKVNGVAKLGRETFVEELERRLAASDDAPLALLLQLGPAAREDSVQKRGAPAFDLPLVHACTALERALPDAVQALRAHLFALADERLASHKEQQRAQTFQDLLEQVHGALQDTRRKKPLLAAVRSRWHAALIDEFQDTDPLQYEIFAECFAGRPLFLVGDPKQSIYGFRGADVHAYLRARADARQTWTLGENHRSHQDLVAATGRLFAAKAAFALAGIEMPQVRAALDPRDCALLGDDREALQIRALPPSDSGSRFHNRPWAERRVTVDVADEIVRLLAAGVQVDAADPARRRPLSAGDIAVLTRTNVQAVAMQDELRDRGVHSAIGRAGDVFRCPEMDDMQRLLAALIAGGHLPTLRAAWSTALFGMSIDDLRALDADPDRLAAELARADALRRTWVRHGFVVMFEDLLHETAGRQRLLQRPDGERKLTNYLQIAELLHHAEHRRQLAPESLVLWLQHERLHAEEIDYQLRELRLESDADAVQILTVHGSKGLQYEVVFVPFAWTPPFDAKAPLLVRGGDGGFVFDCRDKTELDSAAWLAEELAESLRLCYVALTRAKRRCYVHSVPGTRSEQSALAWLLHGPGRDPAADPTPDEQWHAEVKKRLLSWRDDLVVLAAASAGTIGLVDVPRDLPAGEPPHLRTGEPRRTAAPRPLPDRARARSSIQSFTSILSRDRSAEPVVEIDETDAPPPRADAGPPSGIFAFARGARAGVCLHEILEHCDFAAPGSDAIRAHVRRRLEAHGLLDPAAHAAPIDAEATVLAMLLRTASAPLVPLPFRLADLGRREAEWQFFLAAGQPDGRLRPSDLATVFERHGAPGLRGYAQRLRSLSPHAMHGFLRGFVDLVAEHGGRYFVFDWKSNHLGAAADDYAPPRLAEHVQQSDYVLQYHLYLLALHRHLAARLPDYDYDRHVGGACYLYLRGLDDEGQGNGVFVDRPDRGCIEALDAWLRGGAP